MKTKDRNIAQYRYRIKNPIPFISGFGNPEKRMISPPRLSPYRRNDIFLLLLIILFSSFTSLSTAQSQKFRFSGFAENLTTTWIPAQNFLNVISINGWQMQDGIYNRFNFWYSPVNNLEFNVGMRNNFYFGPMYNTYNQLFGLVGLDYGDLVTYDPGYLDLTFLIADGNSYILYTNFDRANVRWTLNKFELTAGRQRINWGQNLIWNPNDIFNAYNFFDFNYVERPGSDAVLLQYYTGDFSSVQLAGKLSYIQVAQDTNVIILEKELKLTAAAMYRFNRWNYDFQFFGGVMETDVTAGLGWAGDIKGAGFTGEVSWFRDMDQFSDTSGVWVASIAANYTFRNSIFINFSAIYNSGGATDSVNAGAENILSAFTRTFSQSLNAKTLIRSRVNLFGQISYPVTPLINLDLACIVNPLDGSGFVGPTVNFSLTDNISLLAVGQLFWGDPLTEYGGYGQMYFLDLKWSF